jgi:hypothetical protein
MTSAQQVSSRPLPLGKIISSCKTPIGGVDNQGMSEGQCAGWSFVGDLFVTFVPLPQHNSDYGEYQIQYNLKYLKKI